ncbi:MAG: hypothetical protein J1D77_08675 [Muribaculaceae bacterium]|nr:hypothetical protein [Muribaculaceae bacterium]
MITDEIKDCRARLADFRKKRIRCLDYTFGRQWNDLIEVDGRRISEYEYILREGNVPLQNNLIRRIVRNVLGVFRRDLPETMKKFYSGPLSDIDRENSLDELFTRVMEEFLISGMAVVRKRLGATITTEIVSPDTFFFNADSNDFRGRDLSMVGQLHSVDFTTWCRAFVKTRADYKAALGLFGDTRRHIGVTEVWRKELRPRYLVHDSSTGSLIKLDDPQAPGSLRCSAGSRQWAPGSRQKWKLEEVWRYYFLTETGKTILSGDSPYLHGGHPYVVKCYPFLDGEIQSLVADLIDQQRYANRLISLYDWVIRASAKGVLLIPEGAVDPSDIRCVADQWSRFNGVIVYKNRAGNPEPKQINGNTSNLGISELLEIQLKMMEDVSGVNGILQGNTGGGNVSGTLYQSQTTNALYSLADILDSFKAFIRDNAAMDALLLRQHNSKSIDCR